MEKQRKRKAEELLNTHTHDTVFFWNKQLVQSTKKRVINYIPKKLSI